MGNWVTARPTWGVGPSCWAHGCPIGLLSCRAHPMAEGPLGRSVAWGHSSIPAAVGSHSHRALQAVCGDGCYGSSLMLWSREVVGQRKCHPAAWGRGGLVALLPALEKWGRHLLPGCPFLGCTVLLGWGWKQFHSTPSAIISNGKLLMTKPAVLTLRAPQQPRDKRSAPAKDGEREARPRIPTRVGWKRRAGGHAVMPGVPRAPRGSGRERPPAVMATWAPAAAAGLRGDAFKLMPPLCVGRGCVPPPSLARGVGTVSPLRRRDGGLDEPPRHGMEPSWQRAVLQTMSTWRLVAAAPVALGPVTQRGRLIPASCRAGASAPHGAPHICGLWVGELC